MEFNTMNVRTAVSKINQFGVLLVFPINNRAEPDSLWNQFHPRKTMKWEWTEDSDDKVGNLWHLMKRLSDCKKVIYSKWYQSRATFFSIELFSAMLRVLDVHHLASTMLSAKAKDILEVLEINSPLSTRELKKQTELQGKLNESLYQKAMKELFFRQSIVAFGEVDDGAFPSLAICSTKNLYEEVWKDAENLSLQTAQATVDKFMPLKSLTRKHFDKIVQSMKL